jgi:hypothetical protein
MCRKTFHKWFESIDTDGNHNVSLPELIGALCGIFKVEQPRVVNTY